MNIKKFLLCSLSITFLINLISCGTLRGKMVNQRLNMLNSSNKVADKCLETILDALKNKDKESLKKIFSVSALKEADNLDERMDYIMNLFQGTVISTEADHGMGSESNSNGVHVEENNYYYVVKTDQENYIISFVYINNDNFNSENVGVYMLQIIKEEDKKTDYDGAQLIRCPGIYYPPSDRYKDLNIKPGVKIDGGFEILKFNVDNSKDKYNISATIKSDIAYGDITISFCVYDKDGNRIGVARGGTSKLDAGETFEFNMQPTGYGNDELKYEDIASYKFYGIHAY